MWEPQADTGKVWAVPAIIFMILSVLVFAAGVANAGGFAGMHLTDGRKVVSLEEMAQSFERDDRVRSVLDIPDSRIKNLDLPREKLDVLKRDYVPIGQGNAGWWTRISLHNDSEYSQWRLMLVDDAPQQFEVLVLSTIGDQTEVRMNHWKPIGQQRDIRSGQVGQSLTIDLTPGGRHDVYVLVSGTVEKGTGLTLQAEPWFRIAQRESLAYYALTSGMIIVLALGMLIGWAVLRRPALAFSAIYGIGFLTAWAAWYGMPFTSLEFAGTVYGMHWHFAFGKAGLLVSALMALFMIRQFLDLKRYYPVLAKIVYPLAGFVTVFGAALAIMPVSIEFLINIILLPILFVSTLIALQTAVTGVPQARWVLAGFIPVLLTTSLFSLAHSGLLPLHWFTPLEVSMTVCLQIILMIPAMAFRLRNAVQRYARDAEQARHERNVMENKLTALSNQMLASDRHSEEMDLQWERAVTDPLTGAKNTVAFELELQKVARAIKGGTLDDMSVVMINLDGIKPLNALRGKREGDNYIARFAGMLIDALLGKARLYRLGGDEFALLPMFDADLSEVEDLIQQAVQTTTAELVRQGYVMAQASIGAARFSHGDNQPHKVSRLADEAVWRAKRNAEENAVLKDPAITALGEKAS